jgi:hypothetical protein
VSIDENFDRDRPAVMIDLDRLTANLKEFISEAFRLNMIEMKNIFATKEDLEREINDLALITKKGFDEVYERLVSKKDFERLELRVSHIGSDVQEIKSRVTLIEKTFATKKDVEIIAGHVRSTESIVFENHEPRIFKLEKKLNMA